LTAHQALIDVSSYPDDVEVPSFQRRMKCSKRVDVRPNLKERAWHARHQRATLAAHRFAP
jgi:hypothetical protein